MRGDVPSLPPVFRPRGVPTRAEQNRAYDRRRGSARDRGYSARWDAAARLFKRDYPLCCGCEAVGRIAATSVVDHVVPHEGDMALFWDEENWQPACGWHHSVVKQILEQRFARGELAPEALRLHSPEAVGVTLDQLRRSGAL